MRSLARYALICMACSAPTSACGSRCTPTTEPPQVLVVDAVTNQAICAATVQVRGDRYVRDFQPVAEALARCDGLISLEQRAGEYDLTVTAPGYLPGAERASITKDSCDKYDVQPSGPRNGHPGFGLTITVALIPIEK